MVRSSKGDKVLTILQCQDYIVYLMCASYIHPSHNPPHVLLVTSVLSHIPTSYFRLSHGITNDVRHPFHCYMGEGGITYYYYTIIYYTIIFILLSVTLSSPDLRLLETTCTVQFPCYCLVTTL